MLGKYIVEPMLDGITVCYRCDDITVYVTCRDITVYVMCDDITAYVSCIFIGLDYVSVMLLVHSICYM